MLSAPILPPPPTPQLCLPSRSSSLNKDLPSQFSLSPVLIKEASLLFFLTHTSLQFFFHHKQTYFVSFLAHH